jgi:uncharacterized coiled-coil DUF342 family protein
MDAALGQLKVELSERIDGLSTEMKEFKAEFKEFKAEMSEFKAEFKEFKAEMSEFKTEFKEFKADIKTEIHDLLVKLDERSDRNLERMETRLAGGFWNWARPHDIRQRAEHTLMLGLDERVTLIEGRLTDLESRKQPGA